MDSHEYKAEIQRIMLLANIARDIKVDEVLNAISHAESIGPIVDPSLYLCSIHTLAIQKEIVQAARRFQKDAIQNISKLEELVKAALQENGGRWR